MAKRTAGFHALHAQINPDPVFELNRRQQMWASVPDADGSALDPSAAIVPDETIVAALALIERQQKEIEALKAALRPFAEESECWEPVENEDKICFGHAGAFTDFTMADVREAARVLNGGSK